MLSAHLVHEPHYSTHTRARITMDLLREPHHEAHVCHKHAEIDVLRNCCRNRIALLTQQRKTIATGMREGKRNLEANNPCMQREVLGGGFLLVCFGHGACKLFSS